MIEMCKIVASPKYIINKYKQGYTYQDISNDISFSVYTIGHIIREAGLGRHPVDKDKVIELHNQGLYDIEIAEMLGCTRSNITYILNQAGYINRHSKIDDIELRNRISDSLIGKYTGSNNPNYNGGSTLKQLIRGIMKPINRRVLIESNYTCQHCGSHENLETHHIKPFDLMYNEFIENVYDGNIGTVYQQVTSYPDFMDKSNVIVLCHNCHFATHYSDNPELSLYRYKC